MHGKIKGVNLESLTIVEAHEEGCIATLRDPLANDNNMGKAHGDIGLPRPNDNMLIDKQGFTLSKIGSSKKWKRINQNPNPFLPRPSSIISLDDKRKRADEQLNVAVKAGEGGE